MNTSTESRKAVEGEVVFTGRLAGGRVVPQFILDDADARIEDGRVTTLVSRLVEDELKQALNQESQ